MKKGYTKTKKYDKYFIFILGLAAAALVLAATIKNSAGLSPDAIAYLFAANSLKAGKGFLYFGYLTPMIQWPPLFPALLALISATGIKLAAAARIFNAVAFGLIVLLSGYWFNKYIRFKPFIIIAAAAVFLSVPLFSVSVYIWSEPLFICIVLAFLLSLGRYFNEGKRPAFWLAAVFAALACMTRYVGTITVLTGLTVILFKRDKWFAKLKDAFNFGLISCMPLLLWAIRNYIYSGTLFGNRTPSGYTLKHTARLGYETIFQWFLPIKQLNARYSPNLTLYSGLALAIVFAVAIAVLFIIIRMNHLGRWKKINVVDWSRKNAAPAIPAALFSIFYIIYMIYTASAVAFDQINDRLMSPVFVPLIFLLFFMLDNLPLLLYKYFRSRVLTWILVAIAGIWLIYPAYGVYGKLNGFITNGIGMASEKQWNESELMAEVKVKAVNAIVYTNFADRTYANAGLYTEYVPRKGSLPEYGLKPFLKAVEKDGGAYLAWFERYGMLKSLYTPQELKKYIKLEPVFKASDGMLYKITSR